MSRDGQQTADRYADTVNDALERLAGDGPLWGPGLAAHAPMAAEALASLGYYDEVPRWIEHYRMDRRYTVRPDPDRPLDPENRAEQDAALGDFGRFTDWATMFARELDARPWQDVFAQWWPRLLPGVSGILGHGLIRTAHAVRGLHTVVRPTPAQLTELAQGLALWAARYWSPPSAVRVPPLADAPSSPAPEDARQALVTSTAKVADLLADRPPTPTIAILHAVTIPMAVDMLLPWLPVSSHPDAYHHAISASNVLLQHFGSHLPPAPKRPVERPTPSLRQGVEAAVETGDEHAIKLAEICARSASTHADNEPYLRAVSMLIQQLSAGRAIPGHAR